MAPVFRAEGQCAVHTRVSRESTGICSMDLTLELDAAPHIEVAVLKPKDVHRFATTLRRSKTDAADAAALAEYSLRMPFTPWRAPSRAQLQLRTLSRHIDGLTLDSTRIKNRLHVARGCAITSRPVLDDLKRSLASIARRILKLRCQAMLLVQDEEALRRLFDLLISVPGVAQVSAIQLRGELALLSPEMSARQWVAHCGLDPAHQQSGTSLRKPSRISRAGNRNLRRILFMPALAAACRDPYLGAFYQGLVSRHKAKMQALIAVARKLLHTIYGILKTGTNYDGAKLFPKLIPTS